MGVELVLGTAERGWGLATGVDVVKGDVELESFRGGCGGILALLRSAFIHGCSRHSLALILKLQQHGEAGITFGNQWQ